MTTTDDLFAHIRPASAMYPTSRPAWKLPPAWQQRPQVRTTCPACGGAAVYALGQLPLCQPCRARPGALADAIARTITDLRRLECAWARAKRLAGPAVRKRYKRLAADRDLLLTERGILTADAIQRIERGIAKARARRLDDDTPDPLAALLATELELGNQMALAAERLEDLRAAEELHR